LILSICCNNDMYIHVGYRCSLFYQLVQFIQQNTAARVPPDGVSVFIYSAAGVRIRDRWRDAATEAAKD